MIVNSTTKAVIATNYHLARGFWQRLKGLLGRAALNPQEALVIPHCQSVHMVFMKFPIDVVFCDSSYKVVGLCARINPFCFSPFFFKASFAIELDAGIIEASKTKLGDQIEIK